MKRPLFGVVLAAVLLAVAAWIWTSGPGPAGSDALAASGPPATSDAGARTTTPASQAAPADESPLAPRTAFDATKAWAHLRHFVDIGPRPAGSPELREARAYVTRQLSAMGLTVQEQPFTARTPIGPVDMVNLVVRLPGRRPDRILFTGHYDTKRFRDIRFVGASDGASSAAFLIELARVLHATPHEFTYELVWLDGEEAMVTWQDLDNTYGSRYYVEAARKAHALPLMRAMILVDMIGARNLEIRRDSSSTPWLTDLIWRAARSLAYDYVFVDSTTAVEDDHQPFLAAGVPSVDIIDLVDYPYWHTQDDSLAHVSARSLQIVGDVLLTALPDIEQHLR